MQLLSCGLDTLAEQLSNDQFIHLKVAYPEHWEVLSKKGIYCYDYMNSIFFLYQCKKRKNYTIIN